MRYATALGVSIPQVVSELLRHRVTPEENYHHRKRKKGSSRGSNNSEYQKAYNARRKAAMAAIDPTLLAEIMAEAKANVKKGIS